MPEHKPLTDAELAEMRTYTEAASKGRFALEKRFNEDGYPVYRVHPQTLETPGFGAEFERQEDAKFFDRARTDMPRLLDEVERLREQQRAIENMALYALTGHKVEIAYDHQNKEFRAMVGGTACCEGSGIDIFRAAEHAHELLSE